jgi:hypothetical protein
MKVLYLSPKHNSYGLERFLGHPRSRRLEKIPHEPEAVRRNHLKPWKNSCHGLSQSKTVKLLLYSASTDMPSI